MLKKKEKIIIQLGISILIFLLGVVTGEILMAIR